MSTTHDEPLVGSSTDDRVIFQHPLAYLIGLQGIALLRAFSGAYDRKFTLARLNEIRELLESQDALGAGVELRPMSTCDLYDTWAPMYDGPGNQLLEIEQPIVREILDRLPSESRSTPRAAPAATPSTWPHSVTALSALTRHPACSRRRATRCQPVSSTRPIFTPYHWRMSRSISSSAPSLWCTSRISRGRFVSSHAFSVPAGTSSSRISVT